MNDEEFVPVVPADRLLRVAGALSDGASRLHAQLRHLQPAERDALLELMTDQLTEVIILWVELVRGVVSPTDVDTSATPASGRPERPGRYETARRETAEGQSGRPWHLRSDRAEYETGRHEQASLERNSRGQERFAREKFEQERLDQKRFEQDQEVRAQASRRRSQPQGRPGVDPPVLPTQPPEALGEDETARDELTGALNRQAGFTALGREMDRCRRSGERFALGYLDVDGLKAVNDARGVEAGDELLRKVAAALRATLRSYDVLTRLGGDKFVFSLPGADVSTAEVRFKEFSVILAEAAPGTSASVGFAELHANDTLDDLVSQAETALLKGRRTRRRGRG